MIMKLTPLGVFGAIKPTQREPHGRRARVTARSKGWPTAVFDLLKPLLGARRRPLPLADPALLDRVHPGDAPLPHPDPRLLASHPRAGDDRLLDAASSEAALPLLLENMMKLGVPRRVASFVIPTGYSFNLDGSTLYLVLASMSIAQAAHIDMPLTSQIAMVFTFMLTSKGVAGVPRATLVIIAGTCVWLRPAWRGRRRDDPRRRRDHGHGAKRAQSDRQWSCGVRCRALGRRLRRGKPQDAPAVR